MYKPTLYITMEADPAHYNPESSGLASRLWSFTAPVTLVPSPTAELGLSLRLKCSGRAYWSTTDEVSRTNWEKIVKPFLKDKLFSVVDVLNGINVERYKHYSGPLHFVWLKLVLAPFELRFRLDSNVFNQDSIPDIMALLEQVRKTVNTKVYTTFAGAEEGTVVYLPCRETVDALAKTRAKEATLYEAWCTANELASKEGTEMDATEPTIAPLLTVTDYEFVRLDGEGLVFPVVQ